MNHSMKTHGSCQSIRNLGIHQQAVEMRGPPGCPCLSLGLFGALLKEPGLQSECWSGSIRPVGAFKLAG